MATAGATAAAVFIRATSGRGDALPTPAAALAEAPVAAEAEEAAAVVSEDPDSEPEPDVSSLDAKALAIQLLDEIPTWQKALAAGVPATALLAVIIAARKWSHLESSKPPRGESLRRIRIALRGVGGGGKQTRRHRGRARRGEARFRVLEGDDGEGRGEAR